MENYHFNDKTQYKWPFSIAMLVYQRVSESNISIHIVEICPFSFNDFPGENGDVPWLG